MAFCTINKSNYFHNLSKITKKIDKDKIAVVIKNNAYGHGILEIAKLANEYGIKHSVVCNIMEAKLVSSFFETVLVLQDLPEKKIEQNIIITINSIESIKKIPKGTKVELKVDTGMHRNGVMVNELNDALDLILKLGLKLIGVFTHFSNASKNDKSIYEQKNKFDNIRKVINDDLRFKFNKIRYHCCSSSSIFRLDSNEYDLARIGIASYGYVQLTNEVKSPDLKPVLALWAEKIASKQITEGDSVGYGKVFTAVKKMDVSTYDIGYGDGFLRLDGSDKATIQNGNEILGVVSMNSFSAVGNAHKVCVFSDAQKLSNIHGTIVYEIISNINPNIERKVIG